MKKEIRDAKLSAVEQKRLDRVRRNEPMHPSVVRNLVRRGIVRKIEAMPPVEKFEWNRLVARFYYYEEVK